MGIGLVKQARACGFKRAKQAVLVALAERANEKRLKDRNCCWPSIATLSSDAGYSIRTVQGQLKVLEEEEKITRIYQKGRPTKYWVHPDGRPTPAKSAGVQKSRPTPADSDANPRKTCGETINNRKRTGRATPIEVVASRVTAEVIERKSANDGDDPVDPEEFAAFAKAFRQGMKEEE